MFEAPSGKTHCSGRAPAPATELSTTFREPNAILRGLSTRFPRLGLLRAVTDRCGLASFGCPTTRPPPRHRLEPPCTARNTRPTRRSFARAERRASSARRCRSRPEGGPAHGLGHNKTPKGTSLRSLQLQCKHQSRHFRFVAPSGKTYCMARHQDLPRGLSTTFRVRRPVSGGFSTGFPQWPMNPARR
jgi:hypothetical protein